MSRPRFALLPIVLIAALSSAVVTLAQGVNRLYLVQLSKTFVDPTAVPTPLPTATPGAGGSCDRFLNASGYTGTFSFSFYGTGSFNFVSDGVQKDVSIQHDFSSSVTLGNRVESTDGNGHITDVTWDIVSLNQPVIVVNDSVTTTVASPFEVTHAHATGGTLHTFGAYGALTLYAIDCTYTLTLWPWADLVVSGTPLYDNVFRFTGSFVPAGNGQTISQNVQSLVYVNSQYLGTNRPIYEANIVSAGTELGNFLTWDLLHVELGTLVTSGDILQETATVSWNLTPTP